MDLRVIAFYLPQYHPIPENDAWWGKGFTEWTNVSKARPLFRGHYQPHVPADLGYYDLRLPEARQGQADMAREYGINGFCYYSYWFNGRRLLGRPFDEVLASGKPDFPFCLCWANENWTRVWDGLDKEILIKQSYSEVDDRQHIRWLANAFWDKRYIKVGDRPLFLVYRARSIPDPVKTTSIWREEARNLGLPELYLCRVESFAEEREHPASLGFDASVEFQPDWPSFPALLTVPLRRGKMWQRLTQWGLSSKAYQENDVHSYARVAKLMRRRNIPPYKRFPGVAPGWDNSPRRKHQAIILRGSTPKLYRRWLHATLAKFKPYGPGEDLIFINAWNEWGEGNHLEPDVRWGRAYLEATRRALRET
jgi:lipopolysaccharide biosynthesis protein